LRAGCVAGLRGRFAWPVCVTKLRSISCRAVSARRRSHRGARRIDSPRTLFYDSNGKSRGRI
jgi:hypothetical protein